MWGVQIIATECPDHFIQLQRILNHPIEENVQNFFGGALLRTKKALLEVPGRFLPMECSICAVIA